MLTITLKGNFELVAIETLLFFDCLQLIGNNHLRRLIIMSYRFLSEKREFTNALRRILSRAHKTPLNGE